MQAFELISPILPPLKESDYPEKALQWMEEFKVSHLPILRGKEYLGLVSDTMLLDLEDSQLSFKKQKLNYNVAAIQADKHIYDVIKVVHDSKVTLVPVLDAQNHYQGCIPIANLVESFSSLATFNQSGSIVVLEVNTIDYSLSEIAQIVESNDAKIWSVYVSDSVNSAMSDITLKINRLDLSPVLQTFYRYNYTVKASYHQEEFVDGTQGRYDFLMNYLNL